MDRTSRCPEKLPFDQSYSLATPSQSGKSFLGPLDTTLILTYLFWISLRKLSLPIKGNVLIAWRHILSQSSFENKHIYIYIIMPKKSAFKRERLTIYLYIYLENQSNRLSTEDCIGQGTVERKAVFTFPTVTFQLLLKSYSCQVITAQHRPGRTQ